MAKARISGSSSVFSSGESHFHDAVGTVGLHDGSQLVVFLDERRVNGGIGNGFGERQTKLHILVATEDGFKLFKHYARKKAANA